MRLVRAVLSASVAVAVACGVVACADDGSKLPSVGGGSQSAAGGDLVAVAKSFYNCLKAEGLPVEYENGPDGRSTLVTFDDGVPVIWQSDDTGLQWTGAVPVEDVDEYTEGPNQQMESAAAEAEGDLGAEWSIEPMVQVDGVDRTDVWAKCVADTGYSAQAVWDGTGSTGTDPAYVQATVEANNKWAACVRANGYPNVADSTVPSDSDPWPMVLLPPTITEEQLRALLEVCPIFDPEQMDENQELIEKQFESDPNATGLPEGYEETPVVGFDFPGYRGDYSFGTDFSTMSASQQAIADHLNQLQPILWEARYDYYYEPSVATAGG
jgi:hypothetical protein